MNDKAHRYAGNSITVYYYPDRCIHAAACVQELPTVFDPQRRPWIDPHAASPDEIASAVAQCPSGALQFSRTDGGAQEHTPAVNRVHVQADGPLYLMGSIVLYAADGEKISDETRVALCRCGASRHKPFCDGSHGTDSFRDPGCVRESRECPPPVAPNGGLEVRARQDGPYIVKGPVTIVSDDGSSTVTREKVALCRCGASANKPFCDGSHKSLEFLAD